MHREVNHHFAHLKGDEDMFSNDIHIHHYNEHLNKHMKDSKLMQMKDNIKNN